ncbi:coiled-coil domain-containing protein [Teratosphaeria destructans]|uniref:Coiled-coil domain-containing protein n=1 Tax=Teratosphaeria destructans TaxID=418781 RepID=A0A9W7SI66_9PEZI|nr:coiled-coil domain-containing protein [Teratosphaeria destructans]
MPYFIESSSNKSVSEDEIRSQRIRIKNRRKRYLDLHPEYFSADLELADPLLYDHLVRQFQTPEERERAGRERGHTGNMEADFVRSESRLEALRHPNPNSPVVYKRGPDGSIVSVDADAGEKAQSKEQAWERWKDIMGQRFLRGDDDQFDYKAVDENDDFDDRQEEDREDLDKYVGAQEAEFVGDGTPKGETGVQDF